MAGTGMILFFSVLVSQAIAITFQDRIQREVLCDFCGRFLCVPDVKHPLPVKSN